MPGMWQRRLLTTMFVVLFSGAGALVGVHGYAIFLAVAVIVPLAMILGLASAQWFQARHHRSLR